MGRIIKDDLFNALIAHFMKDESVQLFQALVTSEKTQDAPPESEGE